MDSKMESRLLSGRVGLNIYQALAKNGVTQDGLAEKMGVSPRMVSYWLSGEKLPSLLKLTKIASFLGLSLDDLTR